MHQVLMDYLGKYYSYVTTQNNFQNILSTSTYPDVWKLANLIPIFKKGDKQSIKNCRPISLLPICV